MNFIPKESKLKYALLVFFISNFYISVGQNNTKDTSEWRYIMYYNKGIEAYQNNKYLCADSLFTLSLENEFSEEAVLYRALTRLILTDTCSACKDIEIAAELYADDELFDIYKKYCILKSDTIYYDRKHRKIKTYVGYKYYEEIKKTMCDSLVYGVIHKKNHYSTEEISLNYKYMNVKTVDVYASFVLFDTCRYYNYIYTNDVNNNKYKIKRFEEELKNTISANYNFDTLPKRNRYFSVWIFLDKNGDVTKSFFQFNPFYSFDKAIRENIEFDINNSINQMPRLTPGRLFGEDVGMQYVIIIGI